MYAPSGTLGELIYGSIDIIGFLQLVSTRGGVFMTSQKSIDYFTAYIEHMKQITPLIVYAKCAKCGEGYEFEDKKKWEADTKICDCGGTLEIDNSIDEAISPFKPAEVNSNINASSEGK
jgi:hypothetical protein